MQYLLLIHVNEANAAQQTQAQQEQGLAAFAAYTEALRKADVLRGGNRLQRSSTATTVRLKDGKSQVLDGPYADSKEQLAGYYLIEAPDIDAALSWAARCPAASFGAIEVRPIWDTPNM